MGRIGNIKLVDIMGKTVIVCALRTSFACDLIFDILSDRNNRCDWWRRRRLIIHNNNMRSSIMRTFSNNEFNVTREKTIRNPLNKSKSAHQTKWTESKIQRKHKSHQINLQRYEQRIEVDQMKQCKLKWLNFELHFRRLNNNINSLIKHSIWFKWTGTLFFFSLVSIKFQMKTIIIWLKCPDKCIANLLFEWIYGEQPLSNLFKLNS